MNKEERIFKEQLKEGNFCDDYGGCALIVIKFLWFVFVLKWLFELEIDWVKWSKIIEWE